MLDASQECASGAKQRAGQETGNKEETIPILTKGKQFNGAYFLSLAIFTTVLNVVVLTSSF